MYVPIEAGRVPAMRDVPAKPLPTGALTVAMVASRWGTSDTFVYDQIKCGQLRAFKLGNKLLRIKLEAVEEYECRAVLGALDGSSENDQTDQLTGHGALFGTRVPVPDAASRSARLIRRQQGR